MIRTYDELIRLRSFEERYEYLRIGAQVGAPTFGSDRYLNQILYTSDRWREVRNAVIIRDNGCDLAHEDFQIFEFLTVHHLNPISLSDIETENPDIYDLRFLVCTSLDTHKAIHFGNKAMLPKLPTQRYARDTCLWQRIREETRYG